MALHAGFRVWLHETHSTAAIASLKQVVSFEAKPSRLVDSKLQLASHRLEAIVWRQHNLVEARGGLPAGQDQAKDIAMLVARVRRKSQTHMSGEGRRLRRTNPPVAVDLRPTPHE